MTAIPLVPLRTALEQLAPHDHLCSIYESPEEHFAVAVPFIGIGLDRDEKCIYIADDGTEDAVRHAMDADGIDVERAIATGSLVIATKEAAYMKRGYFDADWMFTFWLDAAATAKREGFSTLRLTGETEWLMRRSQGLERWPEYESRMTQVLAESNCTALCQYNRRLFPPELILDVILTHPTIIYRGMVCRNIYHVPPEELLGTSQAAREVERLLTNIREREDVEHTLREQRDELERSERILRLVLDALPVGVSVIDRSGDFILNNPASRRIWSGTIPRGRERYAESKAWWHDTGEKLTPLDWPSVHALETGEVAIDRVLDIEDYQGVRKTIQNSAVPIRDASDRVTGAVVVNEDISARKVAERELNDSYQQMRMLSGRLMRAQDDERRRIARMLHETTAQDLAALKMLLARLSRTADRLSESERKTVAESMTLAEQSMSEIRTLSYLLHPPFLDEAGLTSALQWFVTGFAERSGISVDLELPETFERLPLDTETALFRIVQEALINIHRHSRSETAIIRLHRNASGLVLSIKDQGGGIPRDALDQIRSGGGNVGVGIAAMSERIEQLGGSLELTSSQNEPSGTTIRVALPIVESPG